MISRLDFKRVLVKESNNYLSRYTGHLDRVQVFSPLTSEQKQLVARALTEMLFSQGETIIEQGETGHTFYMMIKGEVQVMKDGQEHTRLTSTADKVQVFGERALLKDEPRA